MLETISTCTAPKNRLLQWLADCGPDVPDSIRNVVLGEMLATPTIVLAGMLNGLIVSVTALSLDPGILFASLILIDASLVAARFATVHAAHRAAAAGRPYPMDLYLAVTIGWCLLQGCIAFAAIKIGNHMLDVIAVTSPVALAGPICARNYGAPRYAFLLICLVVLPASAGVASTGEPLMWLLAVQSPLFLLSSYGILKRFQKISTEALIAHQESHHRARHDSLTNLLNRAGLAEALEGLHRLPAQPFVLFYLDLDGFKQVNDRFGHAAGDDLLRQVAARLRGQTRAGDVLARLGGDEFVIAARNLGPADASGFADSIIRRIAGEPFDLESVSGVRIGVSIGFACTPHDGVALDDLHKNADAALYESKRAGRGISTRFSQPPATSRERHVRAN